MDNFYKFTTVFREEDTVLDFESDDPRYNIAVFEDRISICAKNIFGISSLFPWQRLAISNILDAVHASTAIKSDLDGSSRQEYLSNEDDREQLARQIILLPTGAGKSLCFQVPAMLLEGPTLVVYPLLALMSDQLRRLEEVGIQPLLLRGEQSAEERKEALWRLENCNDPEKGVKIIIANPEILQSEAILSRLEKIGIAHFAIDEAHCVSEWGESFRPSYLKLKTVIERIKPKAITAFTATASPEVLKRVSEILFDGNAHIVRGETDRSNIHYTVKPCRVKNPALLDVVSKVKKPLVIFASTREGTERIASFLKYTLKHDEIRFYHAALSRAEKESNEKWFNVADDGILVATCAWGMGVDKKNIRTVIHYEAPLTVEAYVQEAGRGGRDGLDSQAILLWSHEDHARLNALEGASRKRAESVIRYAEANTCRRRILLKSLGDVNASSAYAEMTELHCSGCDVCDGTADYYANDERFLLKFIKENNKIYTQSELVEFLYKRKKSWRASDLNSLLNILLKEGKIKKATSFFWKEKLLI